MSQSFDKSTEITEELRLIPRWSMALAVVAFVAMQYLFFYVFPHPHHPVPLGMRLYFSTSWSALAALYMLMVGYISQDAPRRSMNKWLWIVLSVVLQAGIGLVIYFLLRQPVLSSCVSCGSRIESEYNFCPQCDYQVAPACGECHTRVRVTDLFCARCGHDLAADNTPARLRAYHE